MYYPDDLYDDGPDGPPVLKHSGFGIASFLIAIAVGLFEFTIFVVAGVLEASQPGGMDENSPEAVLLGLAMFGGVMAAAFGGALAIAGLCQAHRSKVFAILGLILNAAVGLGVLGLIVIGLMMG
jgi:hypothetical protein